MVTSPWKKWLRMHLAAIPKEQRPWRIGWSKPPFAAKAGSICKGFRSPDKRYNAAYWRTDSIYYLIIDVGLMLYFWFSTNSSDYAQIQYTSSLNFSSLWIPYLKKDYTKVFFFQNSTSISDSRLNCIKCKQVVCMLYIKYL